MVPDRDRDLQHALTGLTATVITFRRDLAGGRLTREACVELALVFLDGANRVLQRLVEGPDTPAGSTTVHSTSRHGKGPGPHDGHSLPGSCLVEGGGEHDGHGAGLGSAGRPAAGP